MIENVWLSNMVAAFWVRLLQLHASSNTCVASRYYAGGPNHPVIEHGLESLEIR
jgi:hypothetical protein